MTGRDVVGRYVNAVCRFFVVNFQTRVRSISGRRPLIATISFGGLLSLVAGAFGIYRGKVAISTKQVSNSLKSSLVTGVKGYQGKAAVKMGKRLVILGWCLAGLGAILLVLGVLAWAISRTPGRGPSFSPPPPSYGK